MIKIIATILLATPLTIGSVVFKAFAISSMWSWYISSFFDVKEINMAIAYGISVLISFLTFGYADQRFMLEYKEKEDTVSFWQKIGFSYFFTSVFLFIAWVGTFFI